MKIGVVFFCSAQGNKPDKYGKKRLDLAVECLQAGYIDTIVISGGKRKVLKLGEIYRDYLIKTGIPEELIWLEGSSNTTATNVKAVKATLISKAIMASDNPETFFESVLMISDSFQLFRVRRLIQKDKPWPWPVSYTSTGISWRYLHLEPIKIILNEFDPNEKTLGWFKRLREQKNY